MNSNDPSKNKPTILARLRRSKLSKDTRGLSTVEYAILLVLIVIAAFGAWKKFGEKVDASVNSANGALTLPAGAPPAPTP